MTLPLGHFADMFAHTDDPWSFRTRFYEERKRALTLAALDKPLFQSVYEPGCANGELSATLAPRCKALLVSDGVEKAVALARRRLAAFPHVRVERHHVPSEWPNETFDGIVLSEIGYFLSLIDVVALFDRATRSLREGGSLVLCHWRRPIEGCELTGDDVHRLFAATTAFRRLVTHVEEDFLLDVWSVGGPSVGTREGLK